MKICIIGAGAIGGLMAARLSRAGNDVTVIDRGAHLATIRSHGLRLIGDDGSEVLADVRALETAANAGQQDLVILAVKAHTLETIAPDVAALTGPETIYLTTQNGLPWWYFHKHGGPYDGLRIANLDPDGILAQHIDPDRITGCVVYPAAALVAPGVIRHVEGDRFPIGELDGTQSSRIDRLAHTLTAAGLKSRVLDDIRSEIWLKVWGNLSFNPISALTHATLSDIATFPETRLLATTMMSEAQDVAAKLGITFRHTIEKRIAGAQAVGAHKTSMLQDVEAGRRLETEALIGSILELAHLTRTPAPSIEAVYACTKLLNVVILKEGAGVRLAAHAA